MVRAFDLLAGLPDDLELGGRVEGCTAKTRRAVMEPRYLLDRTSVFTFVRRDRMRSLPRFQKLRPGEAVLFGNHLWRSALWGSEERATS